MVESSLKKKSNRRFKVDGISKIILAESPIAACKLAAEMKYKRIKSEQFTMNVREIHKSKQLKKSKVYSYNIAIVKKSGKVLARPINPMKGGEGNEGIKFFNDETQSFYTDPTKSYIFDDPVMSFDDLESYILPKSDQVQQTSTQTTNNLTVDTYKVGNKSFIATHNLTKSLDTTFVIVTYWWGKGNNNQNMRYPCPEHLKRRRVGVKRDGIALIDPVSKEQKTSAIFGVDESYAQDPQTFGQHLNIEGLENDGTIEGNTITSDELERLHRLKRAPVTYDRMIKDWEESCNKTGCYFYHIEYPELAKGKNYQMAINAKPLFIKYALEQCKLLFGTKQRNFTGVVYIDGDMTVNKYPAIFELPNVDFMARGWNVDPRASRKVRTKQDDLCFDRIIFETSGGIMFFGDTKQSRDLLMRWRKVSAKPKMIGKADDRIISLIVNVYSLMIPYNIVQLPVEYLWLTDLYGSKDRNGKIGHIVGKGDQADLSGDIIFEHPGCLTSEERATDQGAASDRSAPFYDSVVEDKINCDNVGGIFYNDLLFGMLKPDSYKQAADSYSKYVSVLSSLLSSDSHPMFTIDRTQFKLPHQAPFPHPSTFTPIRGYVVVDNFQLLKRIVGTEWNDIGKAQSWKDILFVPNSSKYKLQSVDADMLTGSVIPMTQFKFFRDYITHQAISNGIEFAAFTKNDNEHKPRFNTNEAMYFSCKSRAVHFFIQLCQNEGSLFEVFKSSMLFMSMIRCLWLDTDEIDNFVNAIIVTREVSMQPLTKST